jgi:hypothetical protein
MSSEGVKGDWLGAVTGGSASSDEKVAEEIGMMLRAQREESEKRAAVYREVERKLQTLGVDAANTIFAMERVLARNESPEAPATVRARLEGGDVLSRARDRLEQAGFQIMSPSRGTAFEGELQDMFEVAYWVQGAGPNERVQEVEHPAILYRGRVLQRGKLVGQSENLASGGRASPAEGTAPTELRRAE